MLRSDGDPGGRLTGGARSADEASGTFCARHPQNCSAAADDGRTKACGSALARAPPDGELGGELPCGR
eukprot:2639507-Prymnesium_polylepis.1